MNSLMQQVRSQGSWSPLALPGAKRGGASVSVSVLALGVWQFFMIKPLRYGLLSAPLTLLATPEAGKDDVLLQLQVRHR
jgi:hypothetical protein